MRNLFQDFPFSLASICTLSFISKLKARSILKVKGCVAKSDAILVAINKWINTNSNEATWSSQWEASQVLLHVLSYHFYEMGYFTELHDGHVINKNIVESYAYFMRK